jgi:uncharacterized caspase-like protein
MRAARAGLSSLVVLALTGCATMAPPAPVPGLITSAPNPESGGDLWRRLVGRWEGTVDLTFPDAMLLVHSVRLVEGRWTVEAEYGTTGVFLAEVPATADVTGDSVALTFSVGVPGQPAAAVALRLTREDELRGSLRFATDARDRPLTLRRLASTRGVPPVRPSTAVDRVSQTAQRAPSPPQPTAAPPSGPVAPPIIASSVADLGATLPGLLRGRWEGSLDFTVSARLLVIDEVKRETAKWNVQARFGVADADLTPVAVTIDTTDDRIVLRFVTSLASRIVLTLHRDAALRGAMKLAFESRERVMELRRITSEDREPLIVAFRSPIDQAWVGDAANVVAAIVTGGKGVARVNVTLNGAPVHEQNESATPRSLVVSVPVTLREGPNVVVVTASGPDGAVKQEARTIFYDRAMVAAPSVPTPPPVMGERWAVIIGIGSYDAKAVPRLRYAVPDAEAVYRTLINVAGFRPDHVVLLTDTTERKPTLRNLRQLLGTFLARSPRKADTVLIFFAGHGAPEVDPRGAERDGLAKYLIPADADPDDLYSTALPMDEIRTIFDRIEAERVIMFLDTCYSGAAGGRTFATKGLRAGGVDDVFLDRLARSKGRAIITASRPGEVSMELAELGHGIFTHYLVQGLMGAADTNRDGIVSLNELYEYVAQQVAHKSRAVGGNQHPMMKGELDGVLPLVRLRQ